MYYTSNDFEKGIGPPRTEVMAIAASMWDHGFESMLAIRAERFKGSVASIQEVGTFYWVFKWMVKAKMIDLGSENRYRLSRVGWPKPEPLVGPNIPASTYDLPDPAHLAFGPVFMTFISTFLGS